MNVLEGALLTGALATGVVVVERIRGRGSGDDVREDVTDVGTSVADRVGKAAGFVGHAGGRVLSWTGEWSESGGDTATRFVSSVGHKMAEGTGYVFGLYAGAVDRVIPGGEKTPVAAEPKTKRTTKAKTKAAA